MPEKNPCRCAAAERYTDWYLITMLLVFPLFPGFSGYSNITFSKFVFFLAVSGVWAVLLLISLLRSRFLPRLDFPQSAALVFLVICTLSLLVSPNRAEAFLGAGRYDGWLTTAVCVLVFLGVSLCTVPKLLHARTFAISISLCSLLALIQLTGRNPLNLYPKGLSYFDAGLRYTGSFLGTIGNTNILDAVLCLALPSFAALYVCGQGWSFLIPLLLSVPVILLAGGDGGHLALAVTLLPALPFLLTDAERARRTLRLSGLLLFVSGLSLFWKPGAGNFRVFVYSSAAAALMGCGAVLSVLSFLRVRRSGPLKKTTLRRLSLFLCVLLLLGGAAAVLFWPAESGTIYELRETLAGRADGGFGSSRLEIWKACLALVPERPLLGGGPGTAALRLDIHFSRYVPETGVTLRSYVDNAHNVYLGTLVNTGLLGLAGLFTVYVLSACSGLRRRSDPLRLALLLGAFCCAVQEFFGLGMCISAPLLWICLGMLCTFDSPQVIPDI